MKINIENICEHQKELGNDFLNFCFEKFEHLDEALAIINDLIISLVIMRHGKNEAKIHLENLKKLCDSKDGDANEQ